MSEKIVATNRKARFEYFILETYEAGISLQGSEIKSIRAGQMSLGEAYVKVEDGKEAWLIGAHTAPYDHSAAGLSDAWIGQGRNRDRQREKAVRQTGNDRQT